MGLGNCDSLTCSNESEISGKHNHDHHIHDSETSFTHDHIEHEGHLDEGILDLLACLWSDLNLSTDNCNLYISSTVEADELSKVKWSKTTILKVLSVLIQPVGTEINSNQIITSNHQFIDDSPPISQCPYRGPPVISC